MSEIFEDVNGFWEIKDKPISKVGVFPYLGASLSGAPDPLAVYMVLRPPEELGSLETVDSFRLQPWVIAHDMLGPKEKGLMPPEEKGVHGVIGEEVYFNLDDGILYANIKCFSEEMKNDIENGVKGLSAGYFHEVDWSGGEWNGQKYDAIQRNIRANHLALVQSGRMGPDVALDSLMSYDPNIFKEENAMNMEELIAAVKALTERLDKLENGTAANGDAGTEPGKDAAAAGKDDAGAGAGTKDAPAAGKDDAETEPEPKPEEVAEALTTLAERLDRLEGENGNAGGDAAAKDAADAAAKDAASEAEKEQGASMDAALIHKNVLADLHVREKLVKKLTPILGSFDHDLMTSLEVAAYACKKLGVPHGKGQAGTAIAAYLHGVATLPAKPGFSMDGAPGSAPGGKSAKMTAYLGGK